MLESLNFEIFGGVSSVAPIENSSLRFLSLLTTPLSPLKNSRRHHCNFILWTAAEDKRWTELALCMVVTWLHWPAWLIDHLYKKSQFEMSYVYKAMLDNSFRQNIKLWLVFTTNSRLHFTKREVKKTLLVLISFNMVQHCREIRFNSPKRKKD